MQAWIFEAIPAFGRVVGIRKDKREQPRFLRYKYMKERGYPSEEEIVGVSHMVLDKFVLSTLKMVTSILNIKFVFGTN